MIDSFRNGFEIGYKGNHDIRRKAPNLKLECGSPEILWSEMMKETKLGRFARPFDEPTFPFYIQSPVGLIPKGADKSETRLIFHLSYPRGGISVNSETPREMCTVSYDLSQAIKLFKKFAH